MKEGKIPDLVIFDLDGTLIDSLRDLSEAVNVMRESFGLPRLDVDTVASYVGNGVKLLVQRALGGAPVDFETAMRRMREYYAEHLTVYTVLYPGVASGLAELRRRGIKLAVATNKPSAAACGILEKLGVYGLFDGVAGGDSGLPLKPEPDVLLAFRKQFGARECWMFGDHYTDMEAGRRAGFLRVFASYGFGEARDERPDLIVDSFAEFVAAVTMQS